MYPITKSITSGCREGLSSLRLFQKIHPAKSWVWSKFFAAFYLLHSFTNAMNSFGAFFVNRRRPWNEHQEQDTGKRACPFNRNYKWHRSISSILLRNFDMGVDFAWTAVNWWSGLGTSVWIYVWVLYHIAGMSTEVVYTFAVWWTMSGWLFWMQEEEFLRYIKRNMDYNLNEWICTKTELGRCGRLQTHILLSRCMINGKWRW
jgi:hypothetical protein